MLFPTSHTAVRMTCHAPAHVLLFKSVGYLDSQARKMLRTDPGEAIAERKLFALFYASLAIAVVLSFVSSLSGLQQLQLASTPRLLAWVTRNRNLARLLFDAGLWQGLTLLALAVLASVIARRRGRRLWSGIGWFLTAVAGLVVIMLLEIVAEKYLLKPSLHNLRPGLNLGEGPVTELGYRLLGMDSGGATSTPSGFALRQSILFVFYLVLQCNFRPRRAISGRLLTTANSGLFALVLFGRFAMGMHTVFDILLGVAVGILVFWLGFGVHAGAKGTLRYMEELVAPGAVCFLVIEFYCHRPNHWLLFGAVSASIMAISYALFVFTGLGRRPGGG